MSYREDRDLLFDTDLDDLAARLDFHADSARTLRLVSEG